MKLQSKSQGAWDILRHEVHLALGALEEDEFMVVSVKATNFYVQFAAQGAFGMRAEAVSNFYLDERESLSEEQHHALLYLGWHPPTKLPPELQHRRELDGSPNYFLDAAVPVSHGRLALIALNSLRFVYGAAHPGELQYSSFSRYGVSIRFPTLSILRKTP